MTSSPDAPPRFRAEVDDVRARQAPRFELLRELGDDVESARAGGKIEAPFEGVRSWPNVDGRSRTYVNSGRLS